MALNQLKYSIYYYQNVLDIKHIHVIIYPQDTTTHEKKNKTQTTKNTEQKSHYVTQKSKIRKTKNVNKK